MAHPAALLTEDEVPRLAIGAVTAGDSCGSEYCYTLADSGVFDVTADFHDRTCQLVTQNYRGIVRIRIVHDMHIRTAYSAESYFYLDSINWTLRLREIADLNIAFTWRYLHQCIHYLLFASSEKHLLTMTNYIYAS